MFLRLCDDRGVYHAGGGAEVVKAIMATVLRRKSHRPKIYIFVTMIGSEAENEMARLGYGSNQYTLEIIDMATLQPKNNALPTAATVRRAQT